jgi:hypothetical protein
MARCDECGKRRVVDDDGLCKECRADFFRGAMCCRCEIGLTDEGYCPNDRCMFHTRYQDETPPDFEIPSAEERRYIRKVILPRIDG